MMQPGLISRYNLYLVELNIYTQHEFTIPSYSQRKKLIILDEKSKLNDFTSNRTHTLKLIKNVIDNLIAIVYQIPLS